MIRFSTMLRILASAIAQTRQIPSKRARRADPGLCSNALFRAKSAFDPKYLADSTTELLSPVSENCRNGSSLCFFVIFFINQNSNTNFPSSNPGSNSFIPPSSSAGIGIGKTSSISGTYSRNLGLKIVFFAISVGMSL